MKEKPNDGGPAFPHSIQYIHNGVNFPYHGISVRDYFAAAALQGLMAQIKPEDHWADYRANWSYEVADAMLKRRTEP